MARAALFLLTTFFAATNVALAGPTNGDFETLLTTGWTDQSTNAGQAARVAEGDDFSLETDTTGLSFVSPTHALMLRGGHDSGVGSDGAVESDLFVVTHQSLSIWQRSESTRAVPRTFLFDDGGAPLLSIAWSPSVGAFTEHTLDMSAFCET